MSTAAEAVGSKDYLGMSDEDFLKVNAPEPAPAASEKTDDEKAAEEAAAAALAAAEVVTKTPEETAAEEAAKKLADEEKAKADKELADAEAALAADPAAQAAAVAAAAGEPDKGKTNAEKKKEKADREAAEAAAKIETDKGKTPEQITADKAEADRIAAGGAPKTDAEKAADAERAKAAAPVQLKPEELKSFYDSLIGTPIKANGKSITLKSPEEVLRLVQMGAGYGRKLQDLQPHLKVIRMLEKAELLDEGKISFLIDINGKNPDAIKKIIKDSGIDPLDLNIGDNVSYIPKNHSVSDQEMSFQTALEDVQSHEGGKETLQEIDQKWDLESKNVLFKEPQLLGLIQSQRDNGVYAKITTEMERQKLLGTIPNSTPFLKAYQAVGNILFPPAPEAKPIQLQPVVTPQPQVIATRVEPPKAQVQNSAEAAAAAAPKSAGSRKPAPVNPLAMADDEFLKAFSGRL